MRFIPQNILDKIKQAHQSIYTDNDPRMDIIAQKVAKYLQEGSLLAARTIRTGNVLGPLDICIRRENVNLDPTEIVMAYIENGQAKVATLPYVHTPDQSFEYKYTIGPATDVACDFDGRWHKITDRTGIYFDTAIRWALVTFGEPYIARVNNGALLIQRGQTGTSITLAPDNVTACSLLRAWKNVYLWNHDQGIVCAYIRSGTVRYRNYAQQPPDQPALWEVEREVTQLPSPAQTVSLSRTNDYRLKILCSSNGMMHWVITDRNWANMAIEDHHISGTISGTVTVLEITEDNYYFDHHISGEIQGQVLVCPAIWPQLVSIENTDQFTIVIECDLTLYSDLTGLQDAFTVVDNASNEYTVTSTLKVDDRFIELTVTNFEAASGNLTVTYTHATGPIYAQVEGGCLMELDSFVETFTPELAPPEAYTAHTISGTISGTVEVKEITRIDAIHNHTISGAISGTVTVIHVDDINP